MRNVSLARKTSRARRLVDPFFGESPIIRRLAAEAERVAPSPLPLLIRGETGTGEGVLARWIHQNGPRADEPFVDLNCAGLSRELLETELFGHEKGAFHRGDRRQAGPAGDRPIAARCSSTRSATWTCRCRRSC